MKIDTKQFREHYEELLGLIPKNLSKKLCVFFPQVGKNYYNMEEKILFIGKSVNSWITNKLNMDILFDSKNEERIVNRDDEIYWVERNDNKHYNSNNSAFWRLIRNITKKYILKNDWYNNISWTNLFKISPWAGGNPSGYLQKLQSKICINILNKEIEYLNPKIIVFLTSYWETFYLKSIGLDLNKNKTVKWDKYETYYQIFNNRIYILSHHPQGKKEELHVNAILKAINNCKNK